MNKYNYEKAGVIMGSNYKSKIEEIQTESEMHLREKEKKDSNQVKIDQFKKTISEMSKTQIESLKSEINGIITRMENLIYNEQEEFYCYIDLDMFFAACEIIDKPELADKPFVVGHSIIATANYVARKLGIRSGMPGFIAKKLCPDLIQLEADSEKYRMYSDKVFEIIKQFDENVVKKGIDEGYFKIQLEDQVVLESSDLVNEMIEHTIEQLKKEVFEKTSLTMSIGVSFNQKLAKMAAEKNKPNGLFILRKNKEQVYQYLDELKIRKINGIGPVLEHLLNGIDIFTIKDLRENLYKLFVCFSEREALSLLHDSIGYSEVIEQTVTCPSISKSTTFKATDDISKINLILKNLSDKLVRSSRFSEYLPKTLTVNVKYYDFKMKSKSVTNDGFFSTTKVISDISIELLSSLVDRPIRLVGIKLSNLVSIESLQQQSVLEILVKNKEEEKDRKSEDKFVCPVCFKKVECFGVNKAFERHVGDCLDKQENGNLDEEKDKSKRVSTKKKSHPSGRVLKKSIQ